jgi:hypothetical protein
MSSESNFAYSLKYNTHFIVKNTCTDNHKTISIFNYPINWGQTRDLLQIPGVEEADLRASLLKGVLRHKLLCGDIQLVSSNIDLLQFSDRQRAFLFSYGFNEGVQVGYGELDGYVQNLIASGGSDSAIDADEHETLRQLIHFIDEGPGHGFASAAFKVSLPTGSPFPTSMTWYLDPGHTIKLVDKLITYDTRKFPFILEWRMYAPDGVTVIHTVTDTITYAGNAFESSRVRTVT